MLYHVLFRRMHTKLAKVYYRLRRRHNQTPSSIFATAVTMSLFWAPKELSDLPEMRFKVPFNLIGKLTTAFFNRSIPAHTILGDPGADNGAKGKSQRAGKYGTKKSKERPEEPMGTMSYQTSSRWSPPFWLLIGARKLLCFSAQSEARMAATVWNWSGKTLSPGALLAVLYFSSCHIFPPF